MGYDTPSEVVFVYEMAKWQVGESLHPADKQVRGIQQAYDDLPENPFLAEFFDKYSVAFHLKNRRGLEGASEDHRSTETETETETEKRIPPNPLKNRSASSKTPAQHYAPEFEGFWSEYPRKTGKGGAYKAWGKANPPLDACLCALVWQKKSDQWTRDGGQFIPLPATWINQRRWEDQPPEILPIPKRESRLAY